VSGRSRAESQVGVRLMGVWRVSYSNIQEFFFPRGALRAQACAYYRVKSPFKSFSFLQGAGWVVCACRRVLSCTAALWRCDTVSDTITATGVTAARDERGASYT
jgi:hypothetical protein